MNTKTNIELIRLATIAAIHAGIDVVFDADSGKAYDRNSYEWRPLTDNGDAMTLSIALELNIRHEGWEVIASRVLRPSALQIAQIAMGKERTRTIATRKAIVMAAAKIGEAYEQTN